MRRSQALPFTAAGPWGVSSRLACVQTYRRPTVPLPVSSDGAPCLILVRTGALHVYVNHSTESFV